MGHSKAFKIKTTTQIKMEQYYLNTLIFFFKTQMHIDYVGIEAILQIIDDDEIKDSIKRDLIIETLRNYGLNEVSYRQGRFSPASERTHEELFHEKIHKNIPKPVQRIEFSVINGICGVNISQN